MKSRLLDTNLLQKISNAKNWMLIIPIIFAVVFASVATVQAVTRTNASNRGVILFAGDSNLDLDAGQLNNTLSYFPDHYANSYVSVFVTHYGAGVRYPNCFDPLAPCSTQDYWRLKLTNTFTKVKPDAVVTNLGINDARQLGTSTTFGYANYGKKIDYFMGSIPKNKPVFWLNLPCKIEPSYVQAGCYAVNHNLSVATKRWRNLNIVDWTAAANNHPEYINTGDVHYNGAGLVAMGNLIAKRLDAKFPMPN